MAPADGFSSEDETAQGATAPRTKDLQEMDSPNSGDQGTGTLMSRTHALLRGGRAPHTHTFSVNQMEALSTVCDTLIPSIPHKAAGETNQFRTSLDEDPEYVAKKLHDDVDAFYRLSASAAGLPVEVAGAMTERLKSPVLSLISIVLWLLSTRFGTFCLAGWKGLTTDFPFFQKFSEVTPMRREQIMISWADSSIALFRSIFKIFKSYSQFLFYSKVDANGRNPVHNAIGYSGVDLANPISNFRAPHQLSPRPLENKVVDLGASAGDTSSLRSLLSKAGCTVLDDASKVELASKDRKPSERDVAIECDVVVIGSGAGGGVVAAVLAEAGFRVVILEKGRYFARQDLSLLEGPTYREMYERGGLLSTEDGSIGILAGTTVGGGTAINWAASFKTPAHVLREWSEVHELSLFGSEDYQQAMDAVCSRLGVQSEFRQESFQNKVLREGCEKLGYLVGNIPRNAGTEHNCGHCALGCRTGMKQATSETWLVDATTHNAVILVGCTADAVLHSPNHKKSRKARQAEGVVATVGSGPARLFISARATVVACGSLMTPPLLLRSGLTNPNIGKNLHLHPVQMAWGYFPEGTGPKGTVYEGGIMTCVSYEAAKWETTGYGALLEVPFMLPAFFGALTPWRSGATFKDRLRRYPRTAHIIVLTRDEGSGTVQIEKDGQPKIDYDISKHDADTLVEGTEKALRILIAAGAVEVGTQHQVGQSSLQVLGASHSEIEEFLHRLRTKGLVKGSVQLASAHQMGSCRMGPDPMVSVVDPQGETWEVEGLFVGDASVFPTASGVNPMVTVQSIAYCTAQSVVQFLGPS